MAGSDQVRHCASCDLDVYNFVAMTQREVRELLTTAEGRICGRLYRRADGTLLTSNCPAERRSRRRRRFRVRSAVLAALISLSLGSACTTSQTSSRMKVHVERAESGQAASFAGVVRDETGIPLPGVTVTVRQDGTQQEITAVTDPAGAFAIPSLSDGVYRVEVQLPGMLPMVKERLALRKSEIAHAQVTLRFDAEMVTVGVISLDPADADNGISTTISQDFLDKMPAV